MKTRLVTMEDVPEGGTRIVTDILEWDDLQDPKANRRRLMKQFGMLLNQMLRGDIQSISVERSA